MSIGIEESHLVIEVMLLPYWGMFNATILLRTTTVKVRDDIPCFWFIKFDKTGRFEKCNRRD